MRVVRQVYKYVLYYEPLQRMYLISDGIDTSFMFDSYTKDELMALPNYKFSKKCDKFIKDSLVN